MVNVSFQPSGRSVEVPKGTLVSDAMLEANVYLPLDCGGMGTCGRCRVIAQGETTSPNEAETQIFDHDQLKDGWRLACQTGALGDLVVTLPDLPDAMETSWPIDEGDRRGSASKSPVIRKISFDTPPPSLEDPRSDLARLLEAGTKQYDLKADPQTSSHASKIARSCDWKLDGFVRGHELVGIAPREVKPLGLAVDLGSTKLAAYLMDLESGNVLAARGRVNPQISFGADVVTRLQKAINNPKDSARQTDLIRQILDSLAGELTTDVDAGRDQIVEMSLVGNSVMTHLLLGLPLEQLGAPPFVACIDQTIDLKARELGLHLAPGAYLHLPPLVGGYVGSDNVAMILGSDLDRPGPCRLGLDIGTNTEVVLTVPGGEQDMLIASAPSGPTFEGAHLSSGMRALAGAISSVQIQGGHLKYETIDGSPPAGLCGSGVIDAISELLREGLINDRGHFDRARPEVLTDNGPLRFPIVLADESSTSKEIVVTQEDISQVQLAKAAIHAAGLTLLKLAGLQPSDISEVVLAGSFGSHIDVSCARRIGLVPDVPGATYRQVGNAAGKGAQVLLNDHKARKRAALVPKNARYVELSSKAYFKSAFARSLAFPAP